MDVDEIVRVVRHFISDTQISIVGTESGEYNKAYILSTETGKYVLRVKKKPVHVISTDIAYEVEFMERLAEAQTEVHIPKTIPALSGNLLFEDESAYYNLQTRVPGAKRLGRWYESHALDKQSVKELFSKLATLHNVSRGLKLSNKKNAPTVFDFLADYRATLDSNLLRGAFAETVTEHRGFLRKKLTATEHKLRELGYEQYQKCPVHYDITACNVLWEGDTIVSLIDFDWAQEETPEFDFSRSVMLNCGGFTQGGYSNNLLDTEKVLVAFEAYNASAEMPLGNQELLHTLLDASFLFLAFWSMRAFLEAGEREAYFSAFFQAGIDRLKSPSISL